MWALHDAASRQAIRVHLLLADPPDTNATCARRYAEYAPPGRSTLFDQPSIPRCAAKATVAAASLRRPAPGSTNCESSAKPKLASEMRPVLHAPRLDTLIGSVAVRPLSLRSIVAHFDCCPLSIAELHQVGRASTSNTTDDRVAEYCGAAKGHSSSAKSREDLANARNPHRQQGQQHQVRHDFDGNHRLMRHCAILSENERLGSKNTGS